MALSENTSAERDENGVFRVSLQPSPGGPAIQQVQTQTGTTAEVVLRPVPGPVSISEVIPGNTIFEDERGLITDVVELVNASDAAVDIGGYILQDDIDGKQFEVPQGTIVEPGGYYLIHCAKNQSQGLYADFALSRNGGEQLLLYTASGTLTVPNALLTSLRTKLAALAAQDARFEEHAVVVKVENGFRRLQLATPSGTLIMFK